ncbi:hypothetical protein ABBQ38_003839 [Trebouxia sp. C0009 RCD-2024]
MAQGKMEFAVGAAVILTPQYGIPVFLATSIGKFVLKRRQRRAVKGPMQTETSNGKQQVSLQWSHVSCKIVNDKGETKHLLRDQSAVAEPNRLLAIMGPSGSGKTTLLNTLARQVACQKNLDLAGNLLINGQPIETANIRQGYVQQEDMFFSQLTVRETLMMAAHTRMPGQTSAAQKKAFVEDLIKRLGLTKAADSVVGDKKKRGLSGGEKKRLSIGVELIAQPMLLFTDEPTTGLDSFQAEKVMQTLKNLCKEGHTVISSIHQPRSSIFAMFDDLILLSEGRMLYSGPADQALPYFEQLGHHCPQHYNPAEFLADIISVDASTPEAQQQTRARVDELAEAYLQKKSKDMEAASSSRAGPVGGGQAGPPLERPQCKWQRQAQLLLKRSWRQISRDRATIMARTIANVSAALIFGSIFNRMKLSQTAIQDRLGLLQVAAINTAMGSLVKTCTTFPQERTIVTRERSKRSYEVGPYFLAKLLAELPIGALFPGVFGTLVYPTTGLHRKWSRFARFMGITCLESFTASSMGLAVGSIAPTGDAAQALGPAIMTVFIVFGGYYANTSNVPKGLRWIAHTSLIKYAFEAFCVNEFKGLTFVNDKPGRVGSESGEEVLDRLSFGNSSVKKSALGLTRVMLFNYWLTYSVLKAKKPKFERMRAPTSAEMGQEPGVQSHTRGPARPASLEASDTSMSGPAYNGNGAQ